MIQLLPPNVILRINRCMIPRVIRPLNRPSRSLSRHRIRQAIRPLKCQAILRSRAKSSLYQHGPRNRSASRTYACSIPTTYDALECGDGLAATVTLRRHTWPRGHGETGKFMSRFLGLLPRNTSARWPETPTPRLCAYAASLSATFRRRAN
jgi:hypothetical protein